jgi:hypothetical protein
MRHHASRRGVAGDCLQRRKKMRQGDVLPIYLGLSMGDSFIRATVTVLSRYTLKDFVGCGSESPTLPCGEAFLEYGTMTCRVHLMSGQCEGFHELEALMHIQV